MAGFSNSANRLQPPDFAGGGAKLPKSLATCRNIPIFGRRRPETGFDPHCMADLAVYRAISAMVAGSGRMPDYSRFRETAAAPDVATRIKASIAACHP
jgi:hypothetical protein